MEFLANSLESRETYTSNLENCATSKQMLQALLQRDSVKDEPGTEAIPPFEHSRCTDCSYARAITSDCIDHLNALHNQAMTASKRLQQLVEAREQMRDLAESMDLSDGSKLGADDSAVGALEGMGTNFRSLPTYISPRSPPPSPASTASGLASTSASPSRISSIEKARIRALEGAALGGGLTGSVSLLAEESRLESSETETVRTSNDTDSITDQTSSPAQRLTFDESDAVAGGPVGDSHVAANLLTDNAI